MMWMVWKNFGGLFTFAHYATRLQTWQTAFSQYLCVCVMMTHCQLVPRCTRSLRQLEQLKGPKEKYGENGSGLSVSKDFLEDFLGGKKNSLNKRGWGFETTPPLAMVSNYTYCSLPLA